MIDYITRTYAPHYHDLGPKTRLLLIRHGDVHSDFYNMPYGDTDVPLSKLGIQQSQEMGQRLKNKKLVAVYTSALSRAQYLAQQIAEKHSLEIQPFSCFNERHFGELQKHTWPEIYEKYPDLWEAYKKDFLTTEIPGSESYLKVCDRVLNRLNIILNENKHHTIALAAHAGTLRVIIANALGLQAEQLYQILNEKCTLNIIDYYDNGRAILRTLNA